MICNRYTITIKRLINKIIKKKKDSLFFEPLDNCIKDKYDLVNYSSDTALSQINYLIEHSPKRHLNICLTIYNLERMELYKSYIANFPNIHFKFVEHPTCYRGIKQVFAKIRYNFVMFKCQLWLFESIAQIKMYSVNEQRQLILGYFASCKSNYVFDEKWAAKIRYFCNEKRVTVFSSSHFDSMAKSAAFGVPMNCFLTYGMARNDYLYTNIHDGKVLEWLENVRINDKTRIILYAPTFRDYESKATVQQRSIWGYGYDDDKINWFLKENNITVIAKLHSWQNGRAISSENDSIVLYQPNFDFSFYELMKFADAFITDYSSIGYDWLFMDKPIIYNLWDLERYRKERGLAYEPYERVCGGEIVTNTEELLTAINVALKEDIYADKRRKIKDLMFTVQDFSSAHKVTDVIETYLEREK